jgi:hypothetical protein
MASLLGLFVMVVMAVLGEMLRPLCLVRLAAVVMRARG